jgi:cation diffusion facilitator family transporter
LAGAVITLILFATGAAIIYGAYKKFLNPAKIEFTYLGFMVMIFSAVVNEIMARIKVSIGKKENSITLISDGFHSRVDVFTSLAVFAGLFLTKYWISIDSILAFSIDLYIIKTSFSLGKEAADSLLDVSAGPDIEEKIKSIVKERGIEMDSLKTQKKGSAISTNLEIKLPSNLKIEEATIFSESLREELMKEIKSHEIETRFYRPAFGKGFGWQRREKFNKIFEETEGKGPGGWCVCPKCGNKYPHRKGVPCSELQCPKCEINLERK